MSDAMSKVGGGLASGGEGVLTAYSMIQGARHGIPPGVILQGIHKAQFEKNIMQVQQEILRDPIKADSFVRHIIMHEPYTMQEMMGRMQGPGGGPSPTGTPMPGGGMVGGPDANMSPGPGANTNMTDQIRRLAPGMGVEMDPATGQIKLKVASAEDRPTKLGFGEDYTGKIVGGRRQIRQTTPPSAFAAAWPGAGGGGGGAPGGPANPNAPTNPLLRAGQNMADYNAYAKVSPSQERSAQQTLSSLGTAQDLKAMLADPRFVDAVKSTGPVEGRFRKFQSNTLGGLGMDQPSLRYYEALQYFEGTGFQAFMQGLRNGDVREEIQLHLPRAKYTPEKNAENIDFLLTKYPELLAQIPVGAGGAMIPSETFSERLARANEIADQMGATKGLSPRATSTTPATGGPPSSLPQAPVAATQPGQPAPAKTRTLTGKGGVATGVTAHTNKLIEMWKSQ